MANPHWQVASRYNALYWCNRKFIPPGFSYLRYENPDAIWATAYSEYSGKSVLKLVNCS